MDTYALLLATPDLLERREVAETIAEVTGRTLLDARQQLHHGRGLLADRLAPEQAQELGRRLGGLQVPCFAVPSDALVPPPRPLRIAKGAPQRETLVLEDQLQRRATERFDQLRLFCAGVVETEEPGAEPVGARRRPERAPLLVEDEDRVERQILLDLVFGDGVPRHYRIDAGSFHYGYLAATERLSLRRDDNLVALVQDLLAGAATAWVTAAVDALAAGEVLGAAVVEEVRWYEAEVRWRLQRLRALGPPGGET